MSNHDNIDREAFDPTIEESYWRDQYVNSPNYVAGYDYDRDYLPAYSVGYTNRTRYPAEARFEDHESDLERAWNEIKGESRLAWEEAKLAARDAWERIKR